MVGSRYRIQYIDTDNRNSLSNIFLRRNPRIDIDRRRRINLQIKNNEQLITGKSWLK